MGLKNIKIPEVTTAKPVFDMQAGASAFDVEHLLGLLYSDTAYFAALTQVYQEVFKTFRPDLVIDSFGPFSALAARIERIPLIQITQGNFLADSPGFLWWQGTRPRLPSAANAISAVAVKHGLPPVDRAADILNGDRTFVIGSPETDPVGRAPSVTHVGSLGAGDVGAGLPDWIDSLGGDRPLVWAYTGNPRYGGAAIVTPFTANLFFRPW